MKKNQTRSTESVLISFFPNIDKIALRELLKDDPISSPLKKRKSINDEAFAFLESSSKFTNTFYTENENDTLDKMFASKEKNYIKNVKKAVTTINLPNPLAKQNEMPSFLKHSILRVHKITGKAGHHIANRLRVSALKKDDTIFTLFITGSDDTDFAFKLLTRNFSNLSDNHKSVFIYIFPSFEVDSALNYKNKKDTIINKYALEMRNLDTDRFFFSSEPSKPLEYPSTITQFYKYCKIIPFSFGMFGFSGLKGPKGDKKELEKNINFLMKYHKEPFILTKYDLFECNDPLLSLANDDSKKSYSWLFVFDRMNLYCFNCFKSFSKLVDFKKDKITAFTLLPKHVNQDDIKERFFDEMKENEFSNFDYSCDTYESNASILVKNKINYGNEHYDFVVIYNSYNNNDVNKITYEKQKVSNYEIVMDCLGNICVNNGM
jgi:hypothetical protein